ncbi:MAG TPA: DUF4350 domain-containing protein [Pyrinomonadaceae bacterium]|jgi:hypothetical protein
MRSRLAIIITIALVIGLLIALNATSYVSTEQRVDSEFHPNRSTYNPSATGTRALYDFLSETGRKVIRWRDTPAALLDTGGVSRPSTFVVIGETRVPFEETEARALLRWTEGGGRLVIIDRRPDVRLLPASGYWHVSTELLQYPSLDVHSDNVEEMTAGVQPARASQPTLLTRDVDSVVTSRFAAIIRSTATTDEKETVTDQDAEDETTDESEDESIEDRMNLLQTTPPPPATRQTPRALPPNKGGGYGPGVGDGSAASPVVMPVSPAPVVHLADNRGALLVDYPHGTGRIIILSDPYVVANGGISRADNLQLAVNAVAGAGGLIAFDEYHQGHGVTRNELLAYFAGTPVLAMLAQLALVILIVLWTQGRRFARPLPIARVDRRSKLEFVASMAELQQRSRAYDLAIENIYARTRRALARYGGVESAASSAEIARRVAARSKIDREALESLMRECEDAIAGEPINARQSLALVARLREVERSLGLRMRAREIRQAKEI